MRCFNDYLLVLFFDCRNVDEVCMKLNIIPCMSKFIKLHLLFCKLLHILDIFNILKWLLFDNDLMCLFCLSDCFVSLKDQVPPTTVIAQVYYFFASMICDFFNDGLIYIIFIHLIQYNYDALKCK